MKYILFGEENLLLMSIAGASFASNEESVIFSAKGFFIGIVLYPGGHVGTSQ